MTDIRQHLPDILAAVRQHLNAAGTIEALRASLRELLPASYGIGAGRLVNAQGQHSLPLDMIISDTTIAATHPPVDGVYEAGRALAVVMLAHEPDTPALKELLHHIASVKMLRPSLREKQARPAKKYGQRLKSLLPLGIVACWSLPDLPGNNLEMLALGMNNLLKEQPEPLRPDYLLAHAHGLFYSNPLFTGSSFAPSTINIARASALKKPHPCYVCKQPFTYPHFFYRHLCLSCGDLNYQKRALSADLTGRIALVTGARVKIGYATALRLLRAGAQVIATTRFPHNAACRYSSELDFADWQDRLHIYGLDFRYLPVLERFVEHLRTEYATLDILINNAAQTVHRPLDYYAHLLPLERLPLSELPTAHQGLVRQSHQILPPTPFAMTEESAPSLPASNSAASLPSATLLHEYGAAAILPQEQDQTLFPSGKYDEHQQQIDMRERNSWTLPFNEIDLTEFLEVQVINVTAPFLLISHLHPLLCRSPFTQRFIINVSAIEGQFANTKLGKHVHTNMAKASLNMLTHTAAAELARDSIFMNSVDPGWISQQAPLTDEKNWQQLQQLLPLDLVDAAARICDPIFMSIATGEAAYGCFYKDYSRTFW